MMDDLISRRDAINVVSEITTTMSVCTNKDECYGMKRMQKQAITELANLPSVEPCGNVVSRNAIIQKLNQMDRYVSTELRLCDTDNKFPQNEVFIVDDVYEEIVEQLPSAQPEQHLDEWCVDCKEYDKEKHSCPRWNRVIRQTLLDAQPERKTGHWILDRSGAYCCSKCMEPCAGYVMMKPRDRFCKMCGSRNEVME